MERKQIGANLRKSPELTPLNTGKVLIGCSYQPNINYMADDQRWLQDSLLSKNFESVKPIPMTLADKVILALCVVSVVVVWFTR